MAKKLHTLNIAVIGLGMGRGHLSAFSKYPRSNVVAICDTNPERLANVAAEFDIPQDRCFRDYKALLRQSAGLGLHAVSSALPNTLHKPVTLDAFSAGLHVLCEKPMAMNAREADAMLKASQKARKKLMINFSFRFWSQSRSLKRYVESGALGDIYFGRTVWRRRRGIPGSGWFATREFSGGGPVIDLGVHRLDLAMWLMGSPRPVTVSASTYDHLMKSTASGRTPPADVEDMGCALIRFDNGASLVLEASWAEYGEKAEDMSTQLFGSKGGILQRNIGEGYDFEAHVFSEQAGTLWQCKMQQPLVNPPGAYEDFVDSVLDDREPVATGRHGLDVQLVLDAIYKSAALGKEVRIGK